MCDVCNRTLEQKKQIITDAIRLGFLVRNQSVSEASAFCEQAVQTLYGHAELGMLCFSMCVHAFIGDKTIEMFDSDEKYLEFWDEAVMRVKYFRAQTQILKIIAKLFGESNG